MNPVLWLLSLIFRFVIFLRQQFYKIGLLKTRQVKSPVICIGNLTTGGTGKTPWVQKIAKYIDSQNRRVGILSRGYSGDFDGVLEVTDTMDPRKCGDEPLWLKNNTPARVWVGRSRYKAALAAEKSQQCDVLLLDDGFQHFKLARRADIVLLDATSPRDRYRLLPLGRMREGFSALSRAHTVIINKCNYASAEQVNFLKQAVEVYKSPDDVFYADFVFKEWHPLVEGLENPRPASNVSMTCGLGNPAAFLKTLEDLDLEITKEFIFPDHYYWKTRDIERISYQMRLNASRDLVMTEKDAVKLNRYKRHFAELGIQLWVCKMTIQLQDREPEFNQRLNRLIKE